MDEIRVLVADDLRRVDQVVVARLASDVALVNEIARYIVAGGGKRLRPLAVLLAARACGYEDDRHVEAAAVIEFIHTATLLHDDVVDGSDLRRGRETSNHVWGNSASVLVGDYLYSRAFQLMVTLGDLRIQEVMANATNTIAEGEVLQLMNAHDPGTSEQSYLEVINRKTARLFEAGTQIAAILAGATGGRTQHGRATGTMSAWPSSSSMTRSTMARTEPRVGGKLGDDLAEGQGDAAPHPCDRPRGTRRCGSAAKRRGKRWAAGLRADPPNN
jgi:octaprenyl-diphosphate synthase